MTETSTARMKQLAIVVVVAAVALLAGLWFGERLKESPAPLDLEQATVLGDAGRGLPEFSLTDHAGTAFGPARLEGRWSLLFFGYTYCPDVCPIALSAVHQALAEMPAPPPAAGLGVYFVSVDPARDTLTRLREYVTFFDPDFVGVTGEDAELQKITRALGIVYVRAGEGEGEHYLVDHSASLLLLSPAGKLHAVLSAPHEAERLARNLSAIFNAFETGHG
jgi:protein SCO1